MRALHYIHASLLDFVENSRTGTTLFKIARFGLFGTLQNFLKTGQFDFQWRGR